MILDRNSPIAVLVDRCNLGERHAWEEFYFRYLPLVKCAVSRLCGNQHSEDLEDVVQEVFVHLFKALKQYDSSRSLEAYILEIARRVTISRYRTLSAAKRGGSNPGHVYYIDEGDHALIQLSSSDGDQESLLIRAQETSFLREAFKSLSENCKKLISFRYVRGLSYKEIAIIMEMKEATIRVKISRCLSLLARSYCDVSLKGVSRI